MPKSHVDYLLSPAFRSEPLPLLDLDEKLLEDFKALIPNGEAFLAERGFTLESYRELATFDDDIHKAEAELQAEIREQYESQGYVGRSLTTRKKKNPWFHLLLQGAGGGFVQGSARKQQAAQSRNQTD